MTVEEINQRNEEVLKELSQHVLILEELYEALKTEKAPESVLIAACVAYTIGNCFLYLKEKHVKKEESNTENP